MKTLKSALMVVCLVALCVSASASSLDIGAGARSAAMGGAGLALGDRMGTTAVLNPAAPAAAGGGTRFIWPAVSFHTTGASINNLTDSLSNLSDGGDDDAISLVNDFAKQDTTLSMATTVGFAGPFGVMLQGEARGVIDPGAAAAEWATAGLKFDDLSSIRLDTISGITNPNFTSMVANASAGNVAAATTDFNNYMTDLSQNFVDADVVYGPTLMLSKGFSRKGGTLYLGATGKIMHSEARKWQITAADPTSSFSVGAGGAITSDIVFDAVEAPVDESDSLAIDLGMIYKPQNSVWQYGAVINNAIQPKLNGIANSQGDTSLSFGVAAIPVKGMTFACDLCNITGANGQDAELRFGGEWNIGSALALRAGYSGQNWTYGLKALGINVAFKGRTAQLLTNLIKF
jgi:hypothetical protein